MPLQIHIDKGRGLITTRASGNVGDADFIAMEDLFEKSPDFSRKIRSKRRLKWRARI